MQKIDAADEDDRVDEDVVFVVVESEHNARKVGGLVGTRNGSKQTSSVGWTNVGSVNANKPKTTGKNSAR